MRVEDTPRVDAAAAVVGAEVNPFDRSGSNVWGCFLVRTRDNKDDAWSDWRVCKAPIARAARNLDGVLLVEAACRSCKLVVGARADKMGKHLLQDPREVEIRVSVCRFCALHEGRPEGTDRPPSSLVQGATGYPPLWARLRAGKI